MGGLAGHMSHLYDNRELTFGKMKEIFEAASSGKLKVAEKTDGQNLFISYSIPEGKAKAARNKGNIKNGGMDAYALAKKFAGRGGLTEAFVESFAAFEKVVKSFTDEQKYQIFGADADIFYNAEVMDPRSANVINYDKKSLVIHREGHAWFNKETAAIEDIDVSQNANALESALKRTEQSDEEYTVAMKSLRSLKALSDGSVLEMTLGRMSNFMSENKLSDEDTVGQYIVNKLMEIIDLMGIPMPDDKKAMLIKKLYGTKGVKITDVTKGMQPEYKQRVSEFYKDSKNVLAEIIYPLEDIVHDFSVEVLKGMNSAFVMSNKKEVQRMRAEVADTIDKMQKAGSREAYDFLKKQLKKLKDVENVSTAVEGIVFQHDGYVYKMTGNFAPINQILGFFKYRRGDEVNENRSLTSEYSGAEKKVYFVFGRMNPPTPGHEIMLEEGKIMADADRADFLVYLSKSSDPKKNPLSYSAKVKFFKKLFPRYAPYLIEDESLKTIISIMKDMSGKYSDVTMLVGEDRVEDFENLLDRYNGTEYNFESIQVLNTGDRVEGRSASAMRKLVRDDDLEGFIDSYPANINRELLSAVFNELKIGMNLNENYLDKLINDEVDSVMRRILGD